MLTAGLDREFYVQVIHNPQLKNPIKEEDVSTTESEAKPEVFTRKASGLVRVMSPWSAMFYNILAMGVIFPWTYLWAPGARSRGALVWGIILAMLFELPICVVYVFLSSALPRSGETMFFRAACGAVEQRSPSRCRE